MKNSITILLFAVCMASFTLVGCNGGNANKPANAGPTQGTLGLEKLTPEQQIEKVKNDNSIPEQYKQTYINSIKSKAGGGAPR